MMTTTESVAETRERDADERSLQGCMARFVEKWVSGMDRELQPEFHADLIMLIQAVHRDAMRETHVLLKNALAVMPQSPVIIRKD